MSDPNKSEMIEFLNTLGMDADEFDIEGAIYWFANHYHAGQWSNLYSVLSTSPYRPGMMENGANGETMNTLYDALVSEYASLADCRKVW